VGAGSAREGFGALYLADRGVAFAGRTRSHKGLPSLPVGAGSAREGFGAVYLADRGVAFAGRTRSHKGLPSILVGVGSACEGFGALYLADRGVAFAGRTRSHKGGGVVWSRRGECPAVFLHDRLIWRNAGNRISQ